MFVNDKKSEDTAFQPFEFPRNLIPKQKRIWQKCHNYAFTFRGGYRAAFAQNKINFYALEKGRIKRTNHEHDYGWNKSA